MILGPKFFHIYLTTPIDVLEKIIPEADKKGYQAVVVTCDDSTTRVRDAILPLFLEASNHIDRTIFETVTTSNIDMHDAWVETIPDNTPIGWINIERLRKLTKLPIIFKEILSPLDAELAIKHGADGIVVRFISSFLSSTEGFFHYCYLVIMALV